MEAPLHRDMVDAAIGAQAEHEMDGALDICVVCGRLMIEIVEKRLRCSAGLVLGTTPGGNVVNPGRRP